MKSSKLVKLLQILSDKERKEFHAFVESPYFNKKQDLSRLLEVISNKLLPYKKRDLTEAEAYEILFPETPYDQSKLRKMKHAVLRLLKEFIAIAELRTSPQQMKQKLLGRLNQNVEDELFPHFFNEAIREAEKLDQGSIQWHLDHYKIYLEKYRFLARQPQRNPNGSLDHVISNFRMGFFGEMFRLAFLGKNQKLVNGKAVEQEYFDKSLSDAAAYFHTFPLEGKAYYFLHRLASNDKVFDQAWAFLRASGELLPRRLARDIYTGMLNHCTRRINLGELAERKTMIRLYEEVLAKELLVDNGKLYAGHLKNMVAVAAKEGELAWARTIIDDWCERLYGDYGSNGKNFNLAVLSFFQGEYELAERMFNLVLGDFEDNFYGLDTRSYLLRTYFETGNLLGMESLCDSFRMLLTRAKNISETRKEAHLRFIRYYRRLFHAPSSGTKRLLRLRKDIGEDPRVANVDWLFNKIDHLLDASA